jgi:Phage portal protein, SPP1 Gp6-like
MRIDLFERHPRDKDCPERAWRLDMLSRVLDGSLYDILDYAFSQELKGAGGVGGEYIPVRDRRPCIRYPLPRIVVDDSVSLLFSEGHFPLVQCSDPAVAQTLRDIVREAGLNGVMIDAATQGSVGSVALRLLITRSGRVHVAVMPTQFLTPEWDPEEPGELLRVTERYKVAGCELARDGYGVADESAAYWFQRVWDRESETWFVPWPVDGAAAGGAPRIDDAPGRTTRHGLGFVPMVWIKNLPGGDEIDGACTFEHAIETSIEIDYQLSQAARGLRYSSDPTLLIKEPAGEEGGPIVKSAGKALVVSEGGDAKLLEINGSAAGAVIDFVRALREMALEAIHGNRANADRITAAQSGRALELLYQAVIWLADRLRISYGEQGLLPLLHLIIKASRTRPLRVGNNPGVTLPEGLCLSLKWPPYIEPSKQDQLTETQSLLALLNGGIISRRTAMQHVAGILDIPDTETERVEIANDQAITSRE